MAVGIAVWRALAGRRLRWKLLAAVAVLAVAQWLALPLLVAGLATHSERTTAPSAATLGLHDARDVRFPARDGVRLSGW